MELAVERDVETAVDLTALGSKVAPLALAGERTLPVGDDFAGLFAEGGLVRGRTLVCDGPAATSLALALIAPAVAAGSWVAVVDLPTIGLDAASELGVALERVVAISSGPESERVHCWPDVVAAAADGFDVLLVRVPRDVSPAVLRKLATRIRQRGVVLVAVGDPGDLAGDTVLRSGPSEWSGLGDGHGYLRGRHLVVEASGRRNPGRRRCTLTLPAGAGVAVAADPGTDVDIDVVA